MSENIDEVFAKLPQDWTMWTTPSGFALQITIDGTRYTFDAETVSGVLKKVIEFRPCLHITRRPEPINVDDYKIVRTSIGWDAVRISDGRPWFSTPTRKACLAGIENQVAINKSHIEEWDAKVGELVRTGTEGVDYRYDGPQGVKTR